MKTSFPFPRIFLFLAAGACLGGCLGATTAVNYRQGEAGRNMAVACFNAPSKIVYDAVLETLAGNAAASITERDDARYFLAVYKEFQNLTYRVVPVGSKRSRLEITSDAGSSSPESDEALNAMNEVCSRLGVYCTTGK